MDQERTGRKKVILVADGDIQRLEYVREILTAAGYGVLTATSVEEAEALADTDAIIDLVICSVVMGTGGESGVHLAEYIERSKRTNRTLLFSHFPTELLRHVPGFSNQRHFIENPFTPEELVHRAHYLLRMPRPKKISN